MVVVNHCYDFILADAGMNIRKLSDKLLKIPQPASLPVVKKFPFVFVRDDAFH